MCYNPTGSDNLKWLSEIIFNLKSSNNKCFISQLRAEKRNLGCGCQFWTLAQSNFSSQKPGFFQTCFKLFITSNPLQISSSTRTLFANAGKLISTSKIKPCWRLPPIYGKKLSKNWTISIITFFQQMIIIAKNAQKKATCK